MMELPTWEAYIAAVDESLRAMGEPPASIGELAAVARGNARADDDTQPDLSAYYQRVIDVAYGRVR